MSSETSKKISFASALSSNSAWAADKAQQNPDFFPTLAKGQTPSILWIGCSDSRVPETTILGLAPGDVFVHRNIANIVNPSDISLSSVLEFAINYVKVSHVVLCGHTSCGGAAAALGTGIVGGVLDTWLAPLKAEKKAHLAELESIKDAGARAIRLAELNVLKGVSVLENNHIVEQAVKEGRLSVHGVLFDIASGKLKDLGAAADN